MKINVLVVDDEEKNRKLLDAILKAENYNVLQAEDGETALKIVQSQQVDIIILDIMMPGMDGYEVCEKIKTSKFTQNIPIIMLTAKDMDHGLVEVAKKKANFYIVKPFDSKVLVAQIGRMLKDKKT